MSSGRVGFVRFEHGNQGDLFVNKHLGTIGWFESFEKLSNATNEIKVIGTRHGEKFTKPVHAWRND
jgi:FlaA1/EpsC-like NDP-sugar epimerase